LFLLHPHLSRHPNILRATFRSVLCRGRTVVCDLLIAAASGRLVERLGGGVSGGLNTQLGWEYNASALLDELTFSSQGADPC
jgi:hypothetical protein